MFPSADFSSLHDNLPNPRTPLLIPPGRSVAVWLEARVVAVVVGHACAVERWAC